MNILFISYDFKPTGGGVQRVTDIVARQLASRGHHVVFLCGQTTSKTEGLAAPMYVIEGLPNQSLTKLLVHRYQEILKQEKIEIIVNNYPLHKRGDCFFKYALPGIKKVAFYHGKPFGFLNASLKMLNEKPIVAKWLIKLRLKYQRITLKSRFIEIEKKVDKFCFLCEANIEALRHEMDIPTDKFVAIGNPNTFEVTPSNFSKKENVVLFVGRVNDKVKNIDDFVKVWRIISPKVPEWKAIVVGNNSGCESIVAQHIQHLEFVGFQSSVNHFYEQAKILCLTSHSEGWSMVIAEAMAYGVVPCVFETFGAARVLIDDSVDGYVIAPYDTKSMAERVLNLINNASLLGGMSENAKISISRFSAENIADEYENLFKSLL